jgi:hypothetical protein
MGGDLRFEDGLSGSLRRILAQSEHMQDDLAHGAKVVLKDAKERVPKESGDLAATGHIDRDAGGKNTVAIKFRGPYARYIHEHLFFKHPHGGEAKYLEVALLMQGREAIHQAVEKFWRRIRT